MKAKRTDKFFEGLAARSEANQIRRGGERARVIKRGSKTSPTGHAYYVKTL